MNRRLVVMSALVAVLMVTVVAYGQRPGGQRGQRGPQMMGRGMIGLTQLLRVEAVQKEIKITDEQLTKLRELAQAARGGERPDFQNMSDEERREFMAEMRERQADQEKKLKEILDKKQMTRLNQIRIQAMGARALMSEEVAKELKITEEQRETMRLAQRDVFQEIRAAMQEGERPDREQLTKMMEKANAKMMELLTDDQKAAYKKMVGKKFDVSLLRMGGRRGGQGN
jgi:hypothetical protein